MNKEDKQARREQTGRQGGQVLSPRLTFTWLWIWKLKVSFHSGFRQLEMVLVLSLF